MKALEALAELLTHINFTWVIRKIIGYCGLFKGKPKIYSGDARKAIERLSMAITKKKTITGKQMRTILKKIRKTYIEETHKKRLEYIPA